MDKKERFNKAYNFLKYEGVIKKQEDVAKAMGASAANVSSALNGRERVLTDNFLMRFSAAFRQISLDWLLHEQGPMTAIVPEFKDEDKAQVMEGTADKDVIAEQYKMTERVRELIQETGHLPKTFALEANIEVNDFLRKIKGDYVWSVADVHKICDNFKVRKSWLVGGEGRKFRYSDEVLETIPARPSYDARKGVPYYDVDFEMGYDLMANDQTVNAEYMIDFEPYNNCDFWCNARGNSMYPTISSGDKIAIKEVRDPRSCLISGEIYAIVTTNDLRTIKRIKDNGDTITLIPDNKDYPEQTISKDLILKVYKVMANVKMF